MSFCLASVFSPGGRECDLRVCIVALGFLHLLICVPNGGAQQLKDEKSVDDGREAKLRVCQGYKLCLLS